MTDEVSDEERENFTAVATLALAEDDDLSLVESTAQTENNHSSKDEKNDRERNGHPAEKYQCNGGAETNPARMPPKVTVRPKVQTSNSAQKDWKERLAELTWKHKNFSKFLHTIILYTVMLGMGSMHTVVGPTLLDLAFKLNASVSEISIIYTTQGIGFIVGTIAGGALVDIFPKMLFLVVVTGITAVVTASIPHWPNIWTMCLCFFLRGTSVRSLELGCNVALLDLWGVESSRPMQGLHFFLSIGCALGPMLVQPFLGDAVEQTVKQNPSLSANETISNGNQTGNATFLTGSVSTLTPLPEKILIVNDLTSSHIEIAYMVIGIYLGVITLIALITYLISPPPSQPEVIVETKDDNDDSKLSAREKCQERVFLVKFIFCGTVILFLYFGAILSFDSYLTTFCVESKLRMSQSKGALLSTVFWCAFVIGRLIACFYAGTISNLKIIIIDLTGIVISSIPLSIFVEYHEWVIWAAVVTYGFFMASLGPAAISYTNMFIDVTGKMAAIYMLGAAVGETFSPFVIGKLFEQEPMILMYVVTFISLSFVPLTVIKVRMGHKRGKKPDACTPTVIGQTITRSSTNETSDSQISNVNERHEIDV